MTHLDALLYSILQILFILLIPIRLKQFWSYLKTKILLLITILLYFFEMVINSNLIWKENWKKLARTCSSSQRYIITDWWNINKILGVIAIFFCVVCIIKIHEIKDSYVYIFFKLKSKSFSSSLHINITLKHGVNYLRYLHINIARTGNFCLIISQFSHHTTSLKFAWESKTNIYDIAFIFHEKKWYIV